MKKLEWVLLPAWDDSKPSWSMELSAPVRSFFVENGKLYAITDNSVAELPPFPETVDHHEGRLW